MKNGLTTSTALFAHSAVCAFSVAHALEVIVRGKSGTLSWVFVAAAYIEGLKSQLFFVCIRCFSKIKAGLT